MGRLSIKELRALGVTEDELETARRFQEDQRRAGKPVLPLAVICGKAGAERGKPIDLTAHALRRQSGDDQVALILNQKALSAASDDDASALRRSAQIFNGRRPAQLEFDFFGGGECEPSL